MGLCWNWKLPIWFRILQSVWLVRSWRKGKERRTSTTCTMRFFFWASCNWRGGSIECREILLLHDGIFYLFIIEILVKLGFQNKNKGSLEIMQKMTNGNISNLFAFLAKQLQGLFSKRNSPSYLEKLLFDNAWWQ